MTLDFVATALTFLLSGVLFVVLDSDSRVSPRVPRHFSLPFTSIIGAVIAWRIWA